MTEKEIDMLNRYLSTTRRYFEWGSGDSTYLAQESGVKEIYSVESDFKYFMKVREKCPAACINYVDICADNSSFGYPKTEIKKHNWPAYYQFIKIIKYPIDLILIDGRFRVLCALNAWEHIDGMTTVLIHDYIYRKYYHDTEKVFDITDSNGTLFAFRKKTDVDSFDISKLFALYKDDFK